jgi:hypothetical protein
LKAQEFVALLVFLDDVGPHDVGRHEVGRELDSRGRQVKGVTQRLYELGFAKAGNALEENVPLAEDGHQNIVDYVGVADNYLRDFIVYMSKVLLKGIHPPFRVGHRVRHRLLFSLRKQITASGYLNLVNFRTHRRGDTLEA